MIVCSCRAVNERTTRGCVVAGARSVEAIGAMCGAGTQCGGCRPLLEALLAEAAVADGARTHAAA